MLLFTTLNVIKLYFKATFAALIHKFFTVIFIGPKLYYSVTFHVYLQHYKYSDNIVIQILIDILSSSKNEISRFFLGMIHCPLRQKVVRNILLNFR